MRPVAVLRAAVAALALSLVAVVPGAATGATLDPSSVTATASATVVKVRGGITMGGRVKPASARTVRLQRLVGGAWTTIRVDSSANDTGRYSFAVPTDMFVGRTRYRVHVPATTTHAAVTSGATSVTIVGKGRRTSKSLLFGSDLYRWDPCDTIDYRLNVAQAPGGTRKQVRAAMDRVSAQSGLRFRYAGDTTIIPSSTSTYPRRTDMVLAWTRPGQSPWLPKGPAGVGGAYGRSTRTADGLVGTLGQGFVLIESGIYRELDRGFIPAGGLGWAGTRGQLLMHEIGHAVGMGHAGSDTGQVMHKTMTDQPAIWGKGDASNLDRLGLGAGCIVADRSTARRAGEEPKVAYLP